LIRRQAGPTNGGRTPPDHPWGGGRGKELHRWWSLCTQDWRSAPGTRGCGAPPPTARRPPPRPRPPARVRERGERATGGGRAQQRPWPARWRCWARVGRGESRADAPGSGPGAAGASGGESQGPTAGRGAPGGVRRSGQARGARWARGGRAGALGVGSDLASGPAIVENTTVRGHDEARGGLPGASCARASGALRAAGGARLVHRRCREAQHAAHGAAHQAAARGARAAAARLRGTRRGSPRGPSCAAHDRQGVGAAGRWRERGGRAEG
jgi:hypothetical protein